MPIPGVEGDIEYSALSFPGGGTYLDVWNVLSPGNKKTPYCHLDPDIRRGIREVPGDWRAAFGQCDQAETHLENHDVGKGDLFLFFGWFRKTEYVDGKLQYVKGTPDVNVIYGYLQIGEILKGDAVKQFKWHPHSHNTRKNNTIYVASDALVIDGKDTGLPGAGTLCYSDELVLTAPGQSHSRWKLIDVLKNKKIELSYHPNKPERIKDGYFQSTARGQEFVFDECDTVTKWAKSLIVGNFESSGVCDKIENLLDSPCYIIDILPGRVPKEKAKEYAELEKTFLHTEEFNNKLFNVLMKLRCYFDFKLVLPDGEDETKDYVLADVSAEKLRELVGHSYFQILIGDALLVSDPDDMYMSLFNPSEEMLEFVKSIAALEGMCVWNG